MEEICFMSTFLRARHLVIFGLLFALFSGIPAASHAQVAVFLRLRWRLRGIAGL